MGWKPHCALASLLLLLAWLLVRDAPRLRRDAPVPVGPSPRILAGHAVGEVQRVELAPESGEGLVLERDGAGRWWLLGPDQTRKQADAVRIAQFLDALEFARTVPTAGETRSEPPGRWGVVRLVAGATALDIGVWFPGLSSEDRVELAPGDRPPARAEAPLLRTLLTASPAAWRDPRLLPIDPKRIGRLAVESPGASAELVRERFRWWYVKPVRARTSSLRVAQFLTRLCGLRGAADGPAAGQPAPEPEGAREPPLLQIVLWSEELAGAAELTLSQTAEGSMRLETDSGHRHLEVQPEDLEAIQVDPLGFVPEFLVDVDAASLTRLSLDAATGGWSLGRVDPRTPWEVLHPYQALADPERVDAVLAAVTGLRVQRLIGPQPATAAQPPQAGRIKITLHFERAGTRNAVDPAASGQELVLDLEMLSPAGWVGARSDENILYQVMPDQPEILRLDPLALRDRRVHSAAPADFRSIEIKSGQGRQTWRRGEAVPPRLEELLNALGSLRAVRFVTRDPAESAALGLRPPPLEIDWRTERGGDEVPHRLQVALRPDGQTLATLDESGWVFEVEPAFGAIVQHWISGDGSL